mmetsp:Transcript_6785/g.20594  ORF Transcript_6785/g.20594 Transcript_6785/m.20594 type:complete len:327 (-) Transcript_6785:271-1251(-)
MEGVTKSKSAQKDLSWSPWPRPASIHLARSAALFSSADLALISEIFFMVSSTAPCIFVSPSLPAWLEASLMRFTARRFMDMKVLAPVAAVCAAWIAFSSSASAALSRLAPPSACRRGCSASVAFWKAASQSASLPSASWRMFLTKIISDRSLICVLAAWTFSWQSLARGSSLAMASLANPWERDCASMKRRVVLEEICASCTANSASLTLLSDSFASPASTPSVASAATASIAFATFSSVSFNFLSASSISFFTASRCSTEVKSFLCFATSDWALLNRVWNLISSVLTSTEESFPFASICLAVTNLRTSTSASFAAFSQALVFSLA